MEVGLVGGYMRRERHDADVKWKCAEGVVGRMDEGVVIEDVKRKEGGEGGKPLGKRKMGAEC